MAIRPDFLNMGQARLGQDFKGIVVSGSVGALSCSGPKLCFLLPILQNQLPGKPVMFGIKV
ncbi:hypothetical protein [Cohaesibacter sp. ES.047]|uniref:hypothetical protein n=1 Tax=Cohaesibacter sp. ES.047 TaxID=1798205 RepID=UPI0012FE7194|nr:hypothetical protein [Cohaesibacter sp. ES.047]